MKKILSAFLMMILGVAPAWAQSSLLDIPQVSKKQPIAGADEQDVPVDDELDQYVRQDHQKEVLSNPSLSDFGRANAAINQSSGGNVAIINQTGSNNISSVTQSGDNNYARQSQTGTSNDIYLNQSGKNNHSVEVQKGKYNHKVKIQNGNEYEENTQDNQ